MVMNMPDNLNEKYEKSAIEASDELASKISVRKAAILKELEDALIEAKQIKEGSKKGHTIEEIIFAR